MRKLFHCLDGLLMNDRLEIQGDRLDEINKDLGRMAFVPKAEVAKAIMARKNDTEMKVSLEMAKDHFQRLEHFIAEMKPAPTMEYLRMANVECKRISLALEMAMAMVVDGGLTKQMTTKLQFADAEKLARDNPTTFERPTSEEIASIVVGNYVKVCAGRERFWCEVTALGNPLTARVDNDLIYTPEHGYKCDDIVQIEHKHVYSILE